jgi:hypothetical protein
MRTAAGGRLADAEARLDAPETHQATRTISQP